MELPIGLQITRLPTFVPEGFVNVGKFYPSGHKRKNKKFKKHKKKRKAQKIKGLNCSKRQYSKSFEQVYDYAFNSEPGSHSYSTMKGFYKGMRYSNTERRFAKHLRNNGFPEFEQSMPLYNTYFGDFVWKDQKVLVEVDGFFHTKNRQKEHDARRDRFFMMRGWKVFRIPAPYTDEQLTEFLALVKESLCVT